VSLERCCKACQKSFPLTPEYFQPHRRTCNQCIYAARNRRRAEDPEFRERLNASCLRSYYRHREKRIAEVMERERAILSTKKGRARLRARQRAAYIVRIQDPAQREKKRQTDRRAEAKRSADPQMRTKRAAVRRQSNAADPAAHRRSSLEWQRNNPDKARAIRQRRRARDNDAPGTFSGEDFAWIVRHQKGRCFWCGSKLNGKPNADHLVPLARGGTNWPENIVASCATCNHCKGAKMPEEFMFYLKMEG